MSSLTSRVLLVSALLALGACRSSQREALPLAPDDALDRAIAAREAPSPESELGKRETIALLRKNNPRVRAARADLAAARQVEKAGTPLPNPRVSLGPLLTGGTDVLSAGKWGFETAVGWTVFLANTRSLEQGKKAVDRHRAFVETAAVEREEWLLLRGDAMRMQSERARVRARTRLLGDAERAADLLRELAEAGGTSPLDAELAALEAKRFGADLAGARAAQADAETSCAERLGVDPANIPGIAVCPPRIADVGVPATRELYRIAERSHPELDRLRAEYLVAEKAVRLEIARAFPSLDIDRTLERDSGENRLGFPISVEIPLFDTGQVEIARARGRRSALRERYAARLAAVITEIDGAHRRLLELAARAKSIDEDVRPRAAAARSAAETGLKEGTVDGLRFVGVMGTVREIELSLVDSEAELFEAWHRLERAVGAPLLSWDEVPASEED